MKLTFKNLTIFLIILFFLILFLFGCQTIHYVKPQEVYYTTDNFKSIQIGELIGYEGKDGVIVTKEGWRMHLNDSLIIK